MGAGDKRVTKRAERGDTSVSEVAPEDEEKRSDSQVKDAHKKVDEGEDEEKWTLERLKR